MKNNFGMVLGWIKMYGRWVGKNQVFSVGSKGRKWVGVDIEKKVELVLSQKNIGLYWVGKVYII